MSIEKDKQGFLMRLRDALCAVAAISLFLLALPILLRLPGSEQDNGRRVTAMPFETIAAAHTPTPLPTPYASAEPQMSDVLHFRKDGEIVDGQTIKIAYIPGINLASYRNRAEITIQRPVTPEQDTHYYFLGPPINEWTSTQSVDYCFDFTTIVSPSPSFIPQPEDLPITITYTIRVEDDNRYGGSPPNCAGGYQNIASKDTTTERTVKVEVYDVLFDQAPIGSFPEDMTITATVKGTPPEGIKRWTISTSVNGQNPYVKETEDYSITFRPDNPGTFNVKFELIPDDPKHPTTTRQTTAIYFKLDILRGGTVISNPGTVTSTIVGEQQLLTIRLTPTTGFSIPAREWIITGNRVQNYIANASEGRVVALTNLSTSLIIYYWYDNSATEVTHELNVTGGVLGERVIDLSVTANFSIAKPTITATTSCGTPPGTLPIGMPGIFTLDGVDLRFGLICPNPPSPPGIRFESTLTNPPGFGGSIQWVQKVTSTLRSRTVWATGDVQSFAASNVLDNSYPYAVTPEAQDSPALTIDNTVGANDDPQLSAGSVNDNFEMSLMYKPTGSQTIPVPIKLITWNWGGSVKLDAVPVQWRTTQVIPSNVAVTDSIAFPTWIGNVRNVQWITTP